MHRINERMAAKKENEMRKRKVKENNEEKENTRWERLCKKTRYSVLPATSKNRRRSERH